jgi:hypothetical protein
MCIPCAAHFDDLILDGVCGRGCIRPCVEESTSRAGKGYTKEAGRARRLTHGALGSERWCRFKLPFGRRSPRPRFPRPPPRDIFDLRAASPLLLLTALSLPPQVTSTETAAARPRHRLHSAVTAHTVGAVRTHRGPA